MVNCTLKKKKDYVAGTTIEGEPRLANLNKNFTQANDHSVENESNHYVSMATRIHLLMHPFSLR